MNIKINADRVIAGPVFICHGAEGTDSHTLKIAGTADSPWLSHGVSLNHATAESLSIIPEPYYGVLQKLRPNDDGAEWTLSCPANGTDLDFEYWIQSEFTAAPCKISMRLGDYRREILGRKAPIGAPVKGDQVIAEITVGSFYTKEVLENVEVEWCIDGIPEKTVPTLPSGKSQFDWTFDTAGERTITASFHSPYEDKIVKASFQVVVYEESPWEQAKLFVNGEQVPRTGPIALLRGQPNFLTVQAPSAIAEELRLELTEAGGLNIEASPEFGSWAPRQEDKFSWTLTPDDGVSGRVALVFISREVQLPWELPVWVLSADLADEVDKVLLGEEEYPLDGAWFFRDGPQTVTLICKPGSPLASYPLLQLPSTLLSGLKDGDVEVTRSGDDTWTIAASNNSGTFRVDFVAKGIPVGIPLPVSKVLSLNLADEVKEVLVGGASYPADGLVLFRGVDRTFTLVYHADSPLKGYPLEWLVTLLTGLSDGDVLVTPAGNHTWTVTALNRSGTFRLVLTGKGFNIGMTLPDSKVLSPDLADEIDLVEIDGEEVPAEGPVFVGDKSRTLTFTLRPGSPLENHPVMLKCEIVSGLDPADVESDPVFSKFVLNHSWLVKGLPKHGLFELSLWGEGMANPVILPVCKLVVSNLDDLVPLFDGKEVSFDSPVYPSRGRDHEFELVIPENSLLIGTKAMARWGRRPDNLGVSLYPDVNTPVVLSKITKWQVKCGDVNDGEFSIVFEFELLPEQSLEMKFNLAHQNLRIYSVAHGSNGYEVGQKGTFRAWIKSSLNNSDVSGVAVTWEGDGINEVTTTDSEGKSRIEHIPQSAGDKKLICSVQGRLDPEPIVQESNFTVRPQSIISKYIDFYIGDVKLAHKGLYAVSGSTTFVFNIRTQLFSPASGKFIVLDASSDSHNLKISPRSSGGHGLTMRLNYTVETINRRDGFEVGIKGNPDQIGYEYVHFYIIDGSEHVDGGIDLGEGVFDVSNVEYFTSAANALK